MRAEGIEFGRRWAQAIRRGYPFAGANAETRFDFQQGTVKRVGKNLAHLLSVRIRLRAVLTLNATVATGGNWVDRRTLAAVFGRVTLALSANAPQDQGGATILQSLDDRGLNVLEYMTGQPVIRIVNVNGAQASSYREQPVLPTGGPTAAVAAVAKSPLLGWWHRQYAYQYLAVGDIVTFDLELSLPVGYRYGEREGLNPMPMPYLTGSDCNDCESGGAGYVSFVPPASIGGVATLAFPSNTVDVFGEYTLAQEGKAHQPVLPYIRQLAFGTNNSGIKTFRGAQAFAAFHEGFDGSGDQLADTQDTVVVTCEGLPVVPQIRDERQIMVCSSVEHECADGPFGLALAQDATLQGGGPLDNRPRFVNPGAVLVAQRGALTKMLGSDADGLDIQVVNSTVTPQNNTLISGVWSPNTAEMKRRHNELCAAGKATVLPETKDGSGIVQSATDKVLPGTSYTTKSAS